MQNGLRQPLWKGCSTHKGLYTHRMRTIALEYARPLEDGVLSVCEMSFWYDAGHWILTLCTNRNYHLAAKSFYQSPNITLSTGHCSESERPWHAQFKWDIFIKPLFSLLREPCERGGGKIIEEWETNTAITDRNGRSQKRQHNCVMAAMTPLVFIFACCIFGRLLIFVQHRDIGLMEKFLLIIYVFSQEFYSKLPQDNL